MENKQDVPEEEEDVILFTVNNKESISSLGSETLGRLLLDTGCTRNVCGQTWWRDFQEGLSVEDRDRVQVEDGGGKKFRFGGGEVLTALEKVVSSTAGR